MRNYVTIQQDNPCSESWDKMHPTINGRFCDSCAKNVVDFTTMTDAQVAKYLMEHPGRLCMRIQPNRLNTKIYDAEPVAKTHHTAVSWLMRTAVAVGITLPAKLVATKPVVALVKDKTTQPTGDPTPREIEVSGKVVDAETGTPVKYAELVFSNNTKYYADKDGYFSTKLSLLGGPVTDLTITISASYYTTQNLSFTLPEHGKVLADIKLDKEKQSGNIVYGLAGNRFIDNEHKYKPYFISFGMSVRVLQCPGLEYTPDQSGKYSFTLPDSMINRLVTLQLAKKDGEVLEETSFVPNGYPLRRDLLIEQDGFLTTLGGSMGIVSMAHSIIHIPYVFNIYYYKDDYDGLTINFHPAFTRWYPTIFRSRWFKRN